MNEEVKEDGGAGLSPALGKQRPVDAVPEAAGGPTGAAPSAEGPGEGAEEGVPRVLGLTAAQGGGDDEESRENPAGPVEQVGEVQTAPGNPPGAASAAAGAQQAAAAADAVAAEPAAGGQTPLDRWGRPIRPIVPGNRGAWRPTTRHALPYQPLQQTLDGASGRQATGGMPDDGGGPGAENRETKRWKHDLTFPLGAERMGIPPERSNGTICGSRSRRGGICHAVAGARTDHLGIGRCYLHGGRAKIKTGRYAAFMRPRLADLFQRFREMDRPLENYEELAIARALFAHFMETISGQIEDAADNQEARVGLIGIITHAAELNEGISRTIARIEKVRALNAISYSELMRLMRLMAIVVERHVKDKQTRGAIADEWKRIEIFPNTEAGRGAKNG